ncbi:MAG: hypothetical protein VCC36_10355, partial [Gammaproteobacteria bacterium]
PGRLKMKTVKNQLAEIGFVYALVFGLVCLTFVVAALPELLAFGPVVESVSVNPTSDFYLR